MSTLPGPLNTILHPRKYLARWAKFYSQWEFWVLCVVVLGAYFILKANNLLPRYFVDHPNSAKAVTTALILLPMPYLMSRKEQTRAGQKDWFQRFLAWFARPGKLVPYTITALLVISTICFFCPIFIDVATKQPLSGFALLLRHPIVAGIPVLYIACAALLAWDFREWRWMSLFWIFGAYVGTFAAAGLYTNTDADISSSFEWAATLIMILPLLCMALCLIPQKSHLESSKRQH